MKKVVFTCLCSVLLSLSVFSQQVDSLKARAGGFSTELNVNLFQGELNFNNVLEQIKIRYFFIDRCAMRIAFSIDSKKEKQEANQPYGTNPYYDKIDRKTFSYSLGLGFEHHFKGTRRLSPYIGAELWFGRKKSSENTETKDTSTEINGAWTEYNTTYYASQGSYGGIYYLPVTSTEYVEKGYVAGGLNLLAGFDFYVARNFYVGYEFVVLGISSTKYDTIETITKNKTSGTPSSVYAPTVDNKDFKFGPSLLNGIRVGYFF